MRRLALALLVIVMAPCLATAQEAGKIYRVAAVGAGLGGGADNCGNGISRRLAGIVSDSLRGAGLVDGRNLAFETHCFVSDEQLDAIAVKLANPAPDAVVTIGNIATRVLKKAVRVPIIFIGSTDPIRAGLVQSFRHPGGNATGVANQELDLLDRKAQILRELLPRAERVAYMYVRADEASHFPADSKTPAYSASLGKFGFSLDRVPVDNWDEVEAAIRAMRPQRPDVLVVVPTRWLPSYTPRLFPLATALGIPATCSYTVWVERGCLMAYSVDWDEMAKQAGRMLGKVLAGADPADLPVEQSTKYELWINAKTATALGITIPPALLAQADRVIE